MAGYIVWVYADLVRKGKKTLGQVPESIRAEVKAQLDGNREPDTDA